MGTTQSRPDTDEKVFQSEIPISFSQDVVNQLTDRLDSDETSPERQSTLDNHIRSRIQNELQHLKQEEENIRREIEQALQKENLDRERERDMLHGEDRIETGSVKSSIALMEDIEEIRSKVDKYQAKKDLDKFSEVKANGEAVMLCYKANSIAPLECWREVDKFKASVEQIERQYCQTLH